MAHVDDELAMRRVLADMTTDQPPAPPNRYGAVRRRAVLRRRRVLAGAAAVVAILVAGAIAVPLGLLRIGPQPPAARPHYHVTELPPRPGARHGLVATGRENGIPWYLTAYEDHGMFCTSESTNESSCGNGPPTLASRSGPPVSLQSYNGSSNQVDLATVRTDVTSVQISYDNGQVLTLHPVALFPRQYARLIAVIAPVAGAVTRVTAFSSHGELGYAVPFTTTDSIVLQRWLQPGQPALPRPATYTIGLGVVDGRAWSEHVYLGPWGTCFGSLPNGSFCYTSTGSLLHPGQYVLVPAFGSIYSKVMFVCGQAAPSVSYLLLTKAHGGTLKVGMVAARGWNYFAYAIANSDQVISWAAYDRAGHLLASGPGSRP